MVEPITSATTKDILKTVLEYGELASRVELSEAELDRMEYILIQASNDPILDFWIGEIDYCIGNRLNLIDEYIQPSERNNQLMLERYLEKILHELEFPSQDGETVNLESKVRHLLREVDLNRNPYQIVLAPELVTQVFSLNFPA